MGDKNVAYSKKTEEYLEAVCAQVRWKKACPSIRQEIFAHIEDQQEAFIKNGIEQEEANAKAIKEMGDAVLVGSQFDRVYRPKFNWSIISIVAVMLIGGFFIRLFIANEIDGGYLNFAKELGVFAVAIGVMLAGYFLDVTILAKLNQNIYLAYLAVLAAVIIIPNLRFGLSQFSFDSYDYSSYLIIVFPLAFLGVMSGSNIKKRSSFIKCIILQLVPCLIYALSHSVQTAIICSIIGITMLTFALLNDYFGINKIIGALTIVFSNILLTITSLLLNKDLLPGSLNLSGSYRATQVNEMLAGAKMFGRGSYIEQKITSYTGVNNALTFLIYRLGWFSLAVICILLIAFFITGFIFAIKQKNLLGKMLSIGILSMMSLEAFAYIFVNLVLGTAISLPLPLISYGSIALIAYSFVIGLMLSVFRSEYLLFDKSKFILAR